MGIGGLTLDWLNGGRQTIHGVPFDILDPRAGRAACIALRSRKVRETSGAALPAKVVVPVAKQIRMLYFLHGCGWATQRRVATYRVVYADGSKAEIAILPYGVGSEHLEVMERLRNEASVQDWWPNLVQIENDRLRHVIVANPENLSERRYLYNLQWQNPFPEKAVTALELESDPSLNASMFILAVTAVTVSD